MVSPGSLQQPNSKELPWVLQFLFSEAFCMEKSSFCWLFSCIPSNEKHKPSGIFLFCTLDTIWRRRSRSGYWGLSSWPNMNRINRVKVFQDKCRAYGLMKSQWKWISNWSKYDGSLEHVQKAFLMNWTIHDTVNIWIFRLSLNYHLCQFPRPIFSIEPWWAAYLILW